MSDAYQGSATVADLHSREQHRFHRVQQSATFHTDSGDRDTQAVTELPGNIRDVRALEITFRLQFHPSYRI